MATSIGKHVRLRIFFEDADLPPSWLLVNFSSIATIDDLKKHICLRFLNQDHDLKLSLDGCILPGIERSIILRDNDYVHVRILGHKASANTSYFNEDVLQTDKTVSNIHKDAEVEQDKTDKKKKKKDKKHKHKTSKNSPINEELANSEDNSKKTKRKKHKYDCEDQNSDNSCSGLPKKRKLDSSKSKIDEGLLPSLKSCDPMCSTPNVSVIPMEAGDAAKASTSVQDVEKGDDGAENTADPSKKGKRRRKRTRHRKNNQNSEEKTSRDNDQVKPGVSKPASVPWRFQKKTGISGFNGGSNNKHKVFSSDEDTSESDKEGETTHGHERVNTVEDSCEKNRFNGASPATNYTTTTNNSSFTHTNEDENDRGKNAELQKKKQEALLRVQEIETHQQYGDSNCLEDSVEDSSSSYSSNTVTTSMLPNGVPVYSRQRQRKQNTNRYELTKQQQLNTKLTNRSVVLKGTPERMKVEAKAEDTEQQNSFQNEEVSEEVPMTYEAIPIGKEYSRFPALQGTPRCGDNIAFKVLEMSADYTPEVSKYKEGVVLNFDHDSMTVNVQLTATEAERRPQGKFEMVFDGEEPWSDHTPDDKVSYPWNSLLEPRILT